MPWAHCGCAVCRVVVNLLFPKCVGFSHLLHQARCHHLLPQGTIKAEVVQEPKHATLQLLTTARLQQADQLRHHKGVGSQAAFALLYSQGAAAAGA